MATTKKSTRVSTTKAKRAPGKAAKSSTTRVNTVAAKRAPAKSEARPQTFFTFRATHETVYWLVLGAVVVMMAIWVLSLTIRVQNLYDQIEITNANDGVNAPLKVHKH